MQLLSHEVYRPVPLHVIEIDRELEVYSNYPFGSGVISIRLFLQWHEGVKIRWAKCPSPVSAEVENG